MKKLVLSLVVLLILGLTVSSCVTSKNKSTDFNSEVEKWKTELFLNGEVGPPCEEDYFKWMEENPNYYWGMQEIESKIFDFNSDGIDDGLFILDAVNCVGGNGHGSDFAMLAYSHKGQLLTNKNITGTINDKIKYKLGEKYYIYEVYHIVLHYTTFTKTIGGKYYVWVDSDGGCCPSYEGSFEYNPVDFSIKIENKKINYN